MNCRCNTSGETSDILRLQRPLSVLESEATKTIYANQQVADPSVPMQDYYDSSNYGDADDWLAVEFVWINGRKESVADLFDRRRPARATRSGKQSEYHRLMQEQEFADYLNVGYAMGSIS